MTTFQELGLKNEILTAITEIGYEFPMPIQAEVIPFMLNEEEQRDLVAMAQTGTGKTAAFGLPVLNLIDPSFQRIQSLVLAPTRELCIQIANDLKKYSKLIKGMKVVPVYGGESIVTQFKQLDTPPQVLVATPGRLIDLLERGKVKLDNVNYLVLDEADEMLNMGFQDAIETILDKLPEQRRTLLFSATMPTEIARMSKKYMKERAEITVGTKNEGAKNVDHIYYMVQARQRYLALKRIVDMNPDIFGIVFCRTRQETKEVADKLMHDGYNADALHGDLSQAQRDAVMNKFRIRNLQVLVATDVAARGLDVSDLTHVINYNLPDDVEVYTHRSGRTGRANKSGVSVSIIHVKERNKIRDIERMIKKEFRQERIPVGMDVCKRQLFHLIDRMENVEVNEEQINQFLPEIFGKLEYLDKEDIIKRFVSLEFNRFLDYYKNAEDLNLPERERSDRRGRRDDEGDDRGNRKSRRGQRVRFKMNIGQKQNVSPASVLGIINDTTGDKSIMVGDIEITNKFTFFDVYADQADKVVGAFKVSAPNGVTLQAVSDNDDYSKRKASKGGERRYEGRGRQDDRPRRDRYESKGREGRDSSRDNNRDRNRSSSRERSGNSDKPWRNRY